MRQKRKSHTDSIKKIFVSNILKMFSSNDVVQDVKSRYLVNWDQSAICFAFGENLAVHFIGENTVAVKAKGSNQHRLTASS